MEIIINGDSRRISGPMTVASLLEELGLLRAGSRCRIVGRIVRRIVWGIVWGIVGHFCPRLSGSIQVIEHFNFNIAFVGRVF